jgi:hypothetical protein
MRILIVMQNMYGRQGTDLPAPLLFVINPNNHSGKKMLYITSGHKALFTNCSSIMSGGGPESEGKTDKKYMLKAYLRMNWDLVIYCGKQAEKAYNEFTTKIVEVPVIIMPHPAARSFTNVLKEEIKNYVNSSELKKVKQFKL